MIAARASWFARLRHDGGAHRRRDVGLSVWPGAGRANRTRDHRITQRWDAFREWLAAAVTGPFADFMRRPVWAVILIFILGYKLGEAMAGVMAMPLYVSLGFSLGQIAAVSKLVGIFRDRDRRAGRRSHNGQAWSYSRIDRLWCAAVGSAIYFMCCKRSEVIGSTTWPFASPPRILRVRWRVRRWSLIFRTYAPPTSPRPSMPCSPRSRQSDGTLVASSGGVLAERFGWVRFFLLTTVVTIPALLLLLWIGESASPIREKGFATGGLDWWLRTRTTMRRSLRSDRDKYLAVHDFYRVSTDSSPRMLVQWPVVTS